MCKCFQLIKVICDELKIKSWYGVSFVQENGVDKWHKSIMERDGQIVNYEHILYADLNKTEEEIWQSLRPRYKSYVNKGICAWNVYVVDKYDCQIFEKYKQYHHKISGRITRSKETWDMQLEALKNGEGFMIFVEDQNSEIVGATYFINSKSEVFYLSGAFNRDLFQFPLSHIVQYKAIIYSKSVGLKRYKIGERFYNNGKHKPTNKELSIADFKEGFQTNTYINLYTRLSLESM